MGGGRRQKRHPLIIHQPTPCMCIIAAYFFFFFTLFSPPPLSLSFSLQPHHPACIDTRWHAGPAQAATAPENAANARVWSRSHRSWITKGCKTIKINRTGVPFPLGLDYYYAKCNVHYTHTLPINGLLYELGQPNFAFRITISSDATQLQIWATNWVC